MLDRLAGALLERETLDAADVEALLADGAEVARGAPGSGPGIGGRFERTAGCRVDHWRDRRESAPGRRRLPNGVDLERIERAVREILSRSARIPTATGSQRTPRRVAEMYAEICCRPARRSVAASRDDLRSRSRRDGHGARHPAVLDLRAPPRSVPRPRARRVHPERGRSHHRPVEAGAPRRRLRQATAGAGTAHDADRRRVDGTAAARAVRSS